MDRSWLGRGCFVLTAILICLGGPRHPGGTMEEMLAHPGWVLSHVLILLGFVAFGLGLLFYRSTAPTSGATARWLRYALIGTGLMTIEMIFHTVAYVDHGNLVAGRATPLLSIHLALSVLFYPIFGATVIGLLVVATRERTLGSPWINWLGILGALAHGLSAPLVVLLQVPGARILFPMLLFFALWAGLVGLWPRRLSMPRGEVLPASGSV